MSGSSVNGLALGPQYRAHAKLLWAGAAASAFLRGYTFAPQCAEHVRDFIGGGLQNPDWHAQASNPFSVLDALSNVNALVTQMVVEAKALGLNQLQEITFFSAREKLCPLFPFC